MEVRTRFAPSPTGYMHIGNLRSGLYAYLFARHNHGKFLLRIEDTDQERFVEGATDLIYRTLKDVGMNWDEGPDIGGEYGPYVQSERKSMYLPFAEQLIKSGHAYRCFCTKEELEERRAAAAERGETFKYDKHFPRRRYRPSWTRGCLTSYARTCPQKAPPALPTWCSAPSR